MANSRFRKSRLFLFLLLVILSGVALAGTTLATDEMQIKSTLNTVDMQVFVDDSTGGSWQTMVGAGGTPAFKDSALWCPGATHIAYVKVVNHNTFGIEYSLVLDVPDNGFDNYLTYAVIPVTTTNDLKSNGITDWQKFLANAQSTGTLKKSPEDNFWNTLLHVTDNLLIPRTPMAAATTSAPAEQIYAVAIHMEESTPSTYQDKSVSMYFVLGSEQDVTPNGLNGETTLGSN